LSIRGDIKGDEFGMEALFLGERVHYLLEFEPL
jgi:hypothetical protein